MAKYKMSLFFTFISLILSVQAVAAAKYEKQKGELRMSEKITRFPITFKKQDYNLHGVGYVPCNISERWLQFADTYDEGTGLAFVDVMTKDGKETPRKLCQLCLNIHDLQTELSKISTG